MSLLLQASLELVIAGAPELAMGYTLTLATLSKDQ